MKGGLFGYAAIVILLIAGTAAILNIAKTATVTVDVVTQEGILTSFENFNYFLLKSYKQSIEFISQKTAYDLGKTGGFLQGYNLWEQYPGTDVLKENLKIKIEENLPSSYLKGDREVFVRDINIEVEPQQPSINSAYFTVKGYANISTYGETPDSRVFLNPEINLDVPSSYFKLLEIGRQILEEDKYNSKLNDVNSLWNTLEADFPELDFTLIPTIRDYDVDIVDIIIEHHFCPADFCCFSPLEADESGIIYGGEEIPYDYLKLNFKVKAEQTEQTDPDFDFSLSVNPNTGTKLIICP